jgi:hypothetical protein
MGCQKTQNFDVDFESVEVNIKLTDFGVFHLFKMDKNSKHSNFFQ